MRVTRSVPPGEEGTNGTNYMCLLCFTWIFLSFDGLIKHNAGIFSVAVY